MRIGMLEPGGRRRRWPLAAPALVATMAIGLAACGSSAPPSASSGSKTPATASSGSGSPSAGQTGQSKLPSVDDPAVQSAVTQALGTKTPVTSLDPTIQLAFQHAAMPLNADQLSKALECWKATTCTIGSGKTTLGIADGFGQNTWRKFSKMEIILQALTYPDIGKIISTDAAGDLNKYLQNVRSLGAQGAKAIVAYDDFGAAALPAFQQVQKQGAFVSAFVGGVPGAKPDQVANQVHFDVCKFGQTLADIAVKDMKVTGKVAILNGTPGNPQGATWNKCFEDKLKGTSITVGSKTDTNWTPAGAYNAAAALVSSGTDYRAIFYDYADPLPQVVSAYQKAGKTPPNLATATSNNGLFKVWEAAQGTGKSFQLYYTSGLNWMARTSLTATMQLLAGQKVASDISVPIPVVQAKKGDYNKNAPADYPGPTVLVPKSLVSKMLG
jgi:ABC-type sugar transport system substrate-binding protein